MSITDPPSGRDLRTTLLQLDARRWPVDVGGSTLGDVPDAALDTLAARGIGWVYLVGTAPAGPRARLAARVTAGIRRAVREVAPEHDEDDLVASPFAWSSTSVAGELGGDDALARLRERLAERGIAVMLDFVPNHVGLDHSWARDPAMTMGGTRADLEADPDRFGRVGERVVLHGHDPYLPAWTDTAQLELRSERVRGALLDTARDLAGKADGLRVDMAMLLLDDVVDARLGHRPAPDDPASAALWPTLIDSLREEHPDVLLLAEGYWDREADLLDAGFDACYDKPFLDALLAGDAAAVSRRLTRPDTHRLARFVENHDETRIAAAVPSRRLAAVSTVAALAPGLVFLQAGQERGARLRPPIQLRVTPPEAADVEVADLHAELDRLRRHDVRRTGRPTEFAVAGAALSFGWVGDGGALQVAAHLGGGERARVPAGPGTVALARGEAQRHGDVWELTSGAVRVTTG